MQLARGIGILLVTFGHSIPLKDSYPSIYNFIYSFHMPLFFFLSGFFASKLLHISSLNDWISSIKKNTLKLIIPYFTISLSYGLIKYFIPNMVKRPFVWQDIFYVITAYPLRNPALFLWFLYLIIIMRIVTPIISKINPWLLFVFLLTFQFFPVDWELFAVGWFLNYFIYYFMGIQASLLRNNFFNLMKKHSLTPLIFAVFLISYILLIHLEYSILRYFTACAGTFFVISLCFSFFNFMPKNILEKLGSYSLQIYLLQFFFIFPLAFLLNKINCPDYLIIAATFAVGLICPILVTVDFFPKSKVLSLLYGGIDRSGNYSIKKP